MFGLMAAAQSLFVTFGPWLEDEFGVGTAGLAAVTFGIGGAGAGGLDDVGGPHRPLGQGAQRQPGRGGDGAGGLHAGRCSTGTS